MGLDKDEKKFPVKGCAAGAFAERIKLANTRLHKADFYSLDTIFERNIDAWPGDFTGRTLLAWHKYSQLMQQSDPDLEKALAQYSSNCNPAGYLGMIHPADMFDEQQLAGHGWMLRAMAEIYSDTQNETCRKIAWDIFEKLAHPLACHLSTYPFSDNIRSASGAVDGTADRRIGVWRVSTDVGAIFIFFAGLNDAAEVFELPAEDILAQFVELAEKIDFIQSKYQTHASLTLVRALLRYSRTFRKPSAGLLAKKIYDLYINNAMTLNGANYNWFGRPEWTEPCAIVDSFMAAMELFRRSGRKEYLENAHLIWFSAFERAQRPNGGFGGDSCLHEAEPRLYMKFYEAVNCCNMRAAEGFYTALMQSMYLEDDTLFITLPIPGRYQFADGLAVEIRTVYPYGDLWSAEIIAPGAAEVKKICCFISGRGWMERSGNCELFEFEKHFLNDKKSFVYRRGPLLYGTDDAGVLQPVNTLYKQSSEMAQKLELNIIFN